MGKIITTSGTIQQVTLPYEDDMPKAGGAFTGPVGCTVHAETIVAGHCDIDLSHASNKRSLLVDAAVEIHLGDPGIDGSWTLYLTKSDGADDWAITWKIDSPAITIVWINGSALATLGIQHSAKAVAIIDRVTANTYWIQYKDGFGGH